MSSEADLIARSAAIEAPTGNGAPRGKRETSISVSNVSHFFGEKDTRKQVLFNNNLEISAGELVIMTGPSGSGKTTLLTLIGALRTAQEGSLRVLGRELVGLSVRELIQVRRSIGFIFQMHNLFDSLSAYENVKMSVELHRRATAADHDAIVALLTKLGLGHRIYYKPRQMSGGQRQRVAIARALINRPRLILADEPTAALDKQSSRDVVDLLKALTVEADATILMVTHDSRILNVADRIVNMVDGSIASDVRVQETVAICEFLRPLEIFSRLTPAELSDVAGKMSHERVSPGSMIVRQGDQGDTFYIIREGQVDVAQEGGGARQVIATLGPGEHFGEMALISGEPRNASVIAQSKVELYTLRSDVFRAVIDRSEPFRDQLLKVFFQRN
jgi:putative ABC transport system ATP-binding protein